MAVVFFIPNLYHGINAAANFLNNGIAVFYEDSLMDDYSSRLQSLMQKGGSKAYPNGITRSRLATVMGVTYMAVKKVLDGGKFGAENNLKAARLFGVHPEWLLTGQGPKFVDEDAGAQTVQAAPTSRIESARVFYASDLGEMLRQFTEPSTLRKAYSLAMAAIEGYAQELAGPVAADAGSTPHTPRHR